MTDEQNDAGVRILDIAFGLLSAQIAFISDESGKLPISATDSFSIGYVAGFIDALTQRAGIDDEVKSFALLSILMMKLFGEESGAIFAGHFLHNQHLSEIRNGLISGGNNSLNWLRDSSKPPFGWYKHCR